MTLEQLQQKWNIVTEKLSQQMKPVSFDTWIRPLEVAEGDGNTLLLRCGDPFALDMLKLRYADLITSAVQEEFGSTYNVVFSQQ